MKIVVVGLGYVGAVTAACLAELGHSVVGVDVDPHKLAPLEEGRSPIVEPGLDERVASARASGLLQVSSDLGAAVAEAEAILVSVGTPALSDGTVDLGFVERVTEEIGAALADRSDFVAVVYRSTAPPGTVNDRLVPVLERTSGRRVDEDFGVAMVPEFLREGSGVEDFFDPPFTVAGVREERTLEVVRRIFEGIDRPLNALTVEAAESLKYACNAFHALKITFANEVGRLLGTLGVDAREVMRVFREDDRLNVSAAYLRPGFSFGGSCLPKDLRALMHVARVADVDIPMLNGVMRSNESHIRLAARRILDTGEREVALLGLSFKPQTDDLRESPYVELAELLVGKGVNVRIYDPIVRPDRLFGANRRYVEARLPHLQRMLCGSAAEALQGAAVAVAATADDGVVEALVEAAPALVLDVHGGLGAEVEALPGYAGVAW
jgi:GDP-mannose 6-dehydrogenase